MGSFYTGTYTGDGTASRDIPIADSIVTLNGMFLHNGFTDASPYLIWLQDTFGGVCRWLFSPNQAMPAANVIALGLGKFTVKAGANATGRAYYWFGWADEVGLIDTGSYVGTETGNFNGATFTSGPNNEQQIITLGWQPDFVWTYAAVNNNAELGGVIISDMNQGPISPIPPAPPISGRYFNGSGLLFNGGAQVLATGFEVYHRLNVGNFSGSPVTYHYFAWKEHSRTFSKMGRLVYTGNGSAVDRVLTGPNVADLVITTPTGPADPFISQGNANLSHNARFASQTAGEIMQGFGGFPQGLPESFTGTFAAHIKVLSGTSATIAPGNGPNKGEDINLTNSAYRMYFIEGRQVGDAFPGGVPSISFVPCSGSLFLENSGCKECN